MKLTSEEGRQILDDDHDDWEVAQEEKSSTHVDG